MFARRLAIQLKPNKFAEFIKTFEKDIIPLLRKQRGFEDEITFAAPDGIEVVAISLWNTRDDADTYDASFNVDVVKILETMIAGPPQVGTSEVMHSTFHHIRSGSPGRIIPFPSQQAGDSVLESPPLLFEKPSQSMERRTIRSSISDGKRTVKIELDRILASAVVLSWEDLLNAPHGGLIHIEYAPGESLQYLKVWDLTGKGVWSLVCEYWMSRDPTAVSREGMTFSNDYHSASLTDMFGVIMQHQDHFSDSLDKPGAGLIQVMLPTDLEKLEATAFMTHAYESLGLTFAHVSMAAMA
jgi:hypothetical protein